MRSAVNQALDWIRSLSHPRPGIMAALNDGELTKEREASVRAHFARCATCRNQFDQLHNGLRLFDRSLTSSGPAFSVDDGLKRLSSAMQEDRLHIDNQSLAAKAEVAGALYGRLLSELSIYLGRGTAVRLLERCNHSLQHRDRLSAVVEPVVTTFLGKDAGTAVLANVLRIWDSTHQVAS